MTLNEARRVLNRFVGVLLYGTKTFGVGAINEAPFKRVLGGKAGWYVPPIAALALGSAIIQGVTSLSTYENSKTAVKIRKGLIKFERFLEIHGMLATTLEDLLYVQLPINEKTAIAVAETIACSFALWRAIKCQEHFGFEKLERLSSKIGKKQSESVAVELQNLQVTYIPKHRFSIDDFKKFIREYCPAWDGDLNSDQIDVHQYLEGYICECMRKSPRYFLQIVRHSVTYGAEIACDISFLMYILTGFSPIFDIGLFSLIPTAIIFLIASYVGYSIERTNSLLMEIRASNLSTDIKLHEDIHELLIKFYQKSIRGTGIFAQVAEGLKNFLIESLAFMMILSAPSINEERGGEFSDWLMLIIIPVSLLFSWYSVRNVKQDQLAMVERTGTGHLLLQEQSKVEELKDEEAKSVIAIPIPALKKGKGGIEEINAQHASPGRSPESSANSSDSGSPPRDTKSLPSASPPHSPEEMLLVYSAPDGIREEKAASSSDSRPTGWREWLKFSALGFKSNEQIKSLTIPLISITDDQESIGSALPKPA